jgi:hypothetical protein
MQLLELQRYLERRRDLGDVLLATGLAAVRLPGKAAKRSGGVFEILLMAVSLRKVLIRPFSLAAADCS